MGISMDLYRFFKIKESGMERSRLIKDNRYFNENVHDNHYKGWTTSEINFILENEKMSLVEMGEFLGRSAMSISTKRVRLRQNGVEVKRKKKVRALA